MSVYDYTNALENYQAIQDTTSSMAGAKDKLTGELLLSLGVPASYTVGKIAVKKGADLRKLIPKTKRVERDEGEEVEETPEDVAQNEFQAADLPEAPEEMELTDFNAIPQVEHAFQNPLYNQDAEGQGIQENAIEGEEGADAGEGGAEAGEAGAEAGEAGAEAAEAGAEIGADVATTEEVGLGLDAAGAPEVGVVVAVIGGIVAGIEGLKDLFEHHHTPRIVNNLPQMGI